MQELRVPSAPLCNSDVTKNHRLRIIESWNNLGWKGPFKSPSTMVRDIFNWFRLLRAPCKFLLNVSRIGLSLSFLFWQTHLAAPLLFLFASLAKFSFSCTLAFVTSPLQNWAASPYSSHLFTVRICSKHYN